MPADQRFAELYKKLNKEQKLAVDSIEGPVMVVAGPGTGKTTILTLRIANILKRTDIPADAILALTFTESGAHSMRRKLLNIIGAEAYKVNICTFHGFCNDIISLYPEEFPEIMGAKPASDIDQVSLMRRIFDEENLPSIKTFNSPYHYLKPVLRHIRDLKRDDIDPAEYAEFVKKEEKNFELIPDLYHEKGAHKGEMKGKYITLKKKIGRDKDLLAVYRAYEKKLRKNKLYDYEDMIVETVRALGKKKEFLLELQEKYQYILADEHQDANLSQNKLLELLANFHESPNLFIVGDEKQAIYRFQGASIGNFLYFKKLYPQALVINLSENYRSNQAILDASHSLIEKGVHAPGFLPVRLLGKTAYKAAKIRMMDFENSEEERKFIMEDIGRKIKEGALPGEIAVLFRRNREALSLRRLFEKTSIPFAVFAETNILESLYARKLRALFEVIADLSKEHLLAEALFIDFLGLSNLDVYKILETRFGEKFRLMDILKSDRKLKEAGVELPEKFLYFAEKLILWNRMAKNRGLAEVFEAVVRESGLLPFVLNENGSAKIMEEITSFFDEAKRMEESARGASLSDFLEHLRVMEEHEIPIGKKEEDIGAEAVKLMTAHKSKGLEFDYVYIMGANNGVWGNNRGKHEFSLPQNLVSSDFAPGELDDERRLFYVALTRARKEVIATYHLKNDDGRGLLPSPFLEEISDEHKECVSGDSNSPFPPTPPARRLALHTGAVHSFALDDSSRKSLAKLQVFASHPPRAGGKEDKTLLFAPPRSFGVDLRDKKYLSHLFLEQGLNVSALNSYLECPWKYFFNNLIRLPSAKDKWLLYGTAIHSALKIFFDRYREEKDLSKKDFIFAFENSLKRLPVSSKDFAEALKKGEKALSGYYGAYKNSWPRNSLTEYKISGILLPIEKGKEIINLPLRGNLDKIEILSGSEVNVVDYKTGRQKTRNEIEGKTKSSDGNYKRQLVFYKLLLDGHGHCNACPKGNKNGFKMVSAEIDFLEPDEKGRYRKEKFIISDDEVSELKQTIQKTALEILDFSFWDKTCGEKDCEWCKLRETMKDVSVISASDRSLGQAPAEMEN